MEIKRTCVYPGSFDPFTNGHLDIVARAGVLFDKVVILISGNSAKSGRFIPANVMKSAIEATLLRTFNKPEKYVVGILPEDTTVPGYMIARADDLGGCKNIVRGIRTMEDASSEIMLSEQYSMFSHGTRFEFIPLIAKPQHRCISSTLVREMVKYRVPLDEVPVPTEIANAIDLSMQMQEGQ